MSVLTSAEPTLAHVLDPVVPDEPWVFLGLGVCLVTLVVLHSTIKHGGLRNGRVARSAVLAAAIVSLAFAGLPSVSAWQYGEGLPDLISDPPRPGFSKEIVDLNGDTRLVVDLDGYIHNIGDGPLDVVGNPQLDNGMAQRVYENGEWREVSYPTVRFENDDGHNHFHLIEAVHYVFWNEDQGALAANGSKVGFCLVDTEQMEPGTSQDYSEELDNYCDQDNPESTDLRMGISVGWRDTYDRSTTLQWVDVSELDPGRYWIGAVTDPNNEIVESDEGNNDLVFSDLPAIVPGWLPIAVEAESDGSPVQITLDAREFGTVGAAEFTVVDGPASGSLDVPVGASTRSPTVLYTPDSSFAGTDSFVFAVRDGSTEYPFQAPTAEVVIDVTSPGVGAAPEGNAPTLIAQSTFFDAELGVSFSTEVATLSATGTPVTLYATGLPAGLGVIDNAITGVPADKGIFDAELIGVDQNGAWSSPQVVTFIVEDPESPGLNGGVDRSSPLGQPVRVVLGRTTLGTTYTAQGLPPGLETEGVTPIVVGTPTELGSWPVTFSATPSDDSDDSPEGTRSEITFTWTIRPAVAIEFPL